MRIAQKYDDGLSQACEQGELGIRDQLACLGIYARPELYELAGDAIIHTSAGSIDLHAAEPYGLALPSTIVDCIETIDLSKIRRITFIENKTNYDEYIQSERQFDELVVYHGGFLSPKKKTLFLKLRTAIRTNCDVYFWADIDLGGFQMYAKLQKLIPSVTPMRMSGNEVREYYKNGLERSAGYMEILRTTLKKQEHILFEDAIAEINVLKSPN